MSSKHEDDNFYDEFENEYDYDDMQFGADHKNIQLFHGLGYYQRRWPVCGH